jgi:hypothetical protein
MRSHDTSNDTSNDTSFEIMRLARRAARRGRRFRDGEVARHADDIETCGFHRSGGTSDRGRKPLDPRPPSMPQTPEALIRFFTGVHGDAAAAAERLAMHVARLDTLVQALKDSPLAPGIRIFGSAVSAPEGQIPGDIDAFIVTPDGLDPAVRKAAYAAILRLTEGDNYGLFDPFRTMRSGVRETRVLVTRGDVRQANTWIKADPTTAWAITQAGHAGVPVEAFSRRFADELAPVAAPAP